MNTYALEQSGIGPTSERYPLIVSHHSTRTPLPHHDSRITVTEKTRPHGKSGLAKQR